MTQNKLEDRVSSVYLALAKRAATKGLSVGSSGPELTTDTDLPPSDINFAVEHLIDSDYAEWQRSTDSDPFDFSRAYLTPRGLYVSSILQDQQARQLEDRTIQQPEPIGSPYGFVEEDWDAVSRCKADPNKLNVVLGYQFESRYYESLSLRQNVKAMFERALERYICQPDAPNAALRFTPLAAGYGEHQFNEIARDIISADIAVFETSDGNPNVMLEMGVALTWGVRVLPIKRKGRPKPPSDISGQTWADYIDSGATFVDADHADKLFTMVDRTVRKKRS